MDFQENARRGQERRSVELFLTGGTIVVVIGVLFLLVWTVRHPTNSGASASVALVATATPAGPTVIAVPTVTPPPQPAGVQNL